MWLTSVFLESYAVLGVHRGATSSEISAAFRKQMMIYHPDMQTGASEGERLRATERSKLITEAYRKLKSGAR
jgi:curved DNA-binding protein CbpA